MKKFLILIASAGLAACSSSSTVDGGDGGGSSPCQTSQTYLDFGTCADLADAGGGPFLSGFVITPTQRTACETACASSTDQTSVTHAFACLNAVPVDAGPCSSANENAWVNLVAAEALGCENALQASASAGCYTAVTTIPDAG